MDDALQAPWNGDTNLVMLARQPIVPILLAQVGDAASWRYVEFFTANIRNPNTRRA